MAILFVGVLFTILIGIHVVVVALARTAVQSAADAAVDAAQVAGAGARESEGVLAARLTLAGARASVTCAASTAASAADCTAVRA
ncbi:MAG: hypothetical protein OXI48_09920, partial [bacterium]|nr:hypothetical protein [bacterium]